MAERKLLAEPVTRPDGITITIEDANYWQEPKDGISVRALLVSWYSTNDVRKLGLGDFNVGLSRIGHAYFTAPKLGPGFRLLNDELCDR